MALVIRHCGACDRPRACRIAYSGILWFLCRTCGYLWTEPT